MQQSVINYGKRPTFLLNRDYKSQAEDLPTFYDFRKNEEVAKVGFKDNYSTIIFRYLLGNIQ